MHNITGDKAQTFTDTDTIPSYGAGSEMLWVVPWEVAWQGHAHCSGASTMAHCTANNEHYF